MQLQDFEYLTEGESSYDYSVKQTLICARLLLSKAYICSVTTLLGRFTENVVDFYSV